MASRPSIVPGKYIVTLRPYATPAIKTSHLNTVSALTADTSIPFNCEVDHEFELPHLRGYTAKFDDATKNELESMGEVAAIEPVQIYYHCATQTNATWGLNRISSRTKAAAAGPYKYTYAGEGKDTIA
jgi:hypothetical protein